MTPRMSFAPHVEISADDCGPELARLDRVILETAPEEAQRVVVTSAFRDGDPGMHGKGRARDYDAIWSPGTGDRDQVVLLKVWAKRAQRRLGADYDVLAHSVPGRGGWHVHGEWDPKTTKPIGAGFFERVRV